MRFKIVTLGCKVNLYESEIMHELLVQNGWIEADSDLNLIVVNTCSVTNVADNKSKKMIRRARNNNEKAVLMVCGCASENNREALDYLDIDILLGNKDKSKIIELVEEFREKKNKIVRFYDSAKLDFEDMRVSKFSNKTRAFVKIQDGCNNFCSFCIIPYMRGNIRYKDIDLAYEEVLELVNNGHKEIVLTGIHTGSYGRGTESDLVDLIRKISEIEGLLRIRISSIEVSELTDKFINELASNPKICNHMHVPLQSGSDSILKLMNRKYTCAEYEKTLCLLRKAREDISISTDVIVGFPKESEEDFDETLEFVRKLKFSKIHVFPYSKREGTKAADLPNHLDNSLKKSRARKLIRLSDVLEADYNAKFIGSIVDVLVEDVSDIESIGHTSNFIKVKIDETLESNHVYAVKITRGEDNLLVGKID